LRELERLYYIFFEHRSIDDITKDVNAKKWISKEETVRLYEHKLQEIQVHVRRTDEAYNLLLENFNLAVIKNYQERN
jgi:biotin-(acetyl-CoA carboxylase) ligase